MYFISRLPIKIRRGGEMGAEDDSYMYGESPDIPEKYPIYDTEKGTLTVKVTKGNILESRYNKDFL